MTSPGRPAAGWRLQTSLSVVCVCPAHCDEAHTGARSKGLWADARVPPLPYKNSTMAAGGGISLSRGLGAAPDMPVPSRSTACTLKCAASPSRFLK